MAPLVVSLAALPVALLHVRLHFLHVFLHLGFGVGELLLLGRRKHPVDFRTRVRLQGYLLGQQRAVRLAHAGDDRGVVRIIRLGLTQLERIRLRLLVHILERRAVRGHDRLHGFALRIREPESAEHHHRSASVLDALMAMMPPAVVAPAVVPVVVMVVPAMMPLAAIPALVALVFPVVLRGVRPRRRARRLRRVGIGGARRSRHHRQPAGRNERHGQKNANQIHVRCSNS